MTPSTRKHTGLPTRERMAMSRTVPSATPTAVSSRGITPMKGPRATVRSCSGEQERAMPSRIWSRSRAESSPDREEQAAWFSGVSRRLPSGRKRLSIPIIPFYGPVFCG